MSRDTRWILLAEEIAIAEVGGRECYLSKRKIIFIRLSQVIVSEIEGNVAGIVVRMGL